MVVLVNVQVTCWRSASGVWRLYFTCIVLYLPVQRVFDAGIFSLINSTICLSTVVLSRVDCNTGTESQ